MVIKLEQIRDKVLAHTGISEEEFNSKVEMKVKDLNDMISKEGAGQIIAKELGVDLFSGEGNIKIKDLIPGMKLNSMAVKIIKVYEINTFETSKGPGKVGKVLVGDETGKTLMVFWNDKADLLKNIKEEDVVVLSKLVVKTDNRNRTELSFADEGTIQVNPEGLKIEVPDQFLKPVTKKINELTRDEDNVEVNAVIVQILDPVFFDLDKEGKKVSEENQKPSVETGVVVNLFIDDGSKDQVRLVLWKPQLLKLLNIEESELTSYRTNIEGFEKQKQELLGKKIRVIGRTSHNKMFDSIDLTARLIFSDEDDEKQETSNDREEDVEEEIISIHDL